VAWVAEIFQHRDHHKNPNTRNISYLAPTKEEAKRLVLLFMLEDLENNDFNAVEDRGTPELQDALLTGDPDKMIEALLACREALWAGEYVNPTLEVSFYERGQDFDEFPTKRFEQLCEDLRDRFGEYSDEP